MINPITNQYCKEYKTGRYKRVVSRARGLIESSLYNLLRL
jgi:hypothetical protein